MELVWFLENRKTNKPMSGASDDTLLVIRRESDGYLLDWSVNDFVIDGGSRPATKYKEVNQSILPGLYIKFINTSAWNNGDYQAISYYSSTVFINKFEAFIIKAGVKYTDNHEAHLSDVSAKSVSIPESSLLVQEYYNNKDADGNGMIYGVDFYISIDRPKMLDTIPRRGISMTWKEYLASL